MPEPFESGAGDAGGVLIYALELSNVSPWMSEGGVGELDCAELEPEDRMVPLGSSGFGFAKL